MIPALALPHTVTVLEAGSSTDRYGDTAANWTNPTSRTITGLMQPYTTSETFAAGRDEKVTMWHLYTDDTGVTDGQRILWNDFIFEVYGTPETFSLFSGSPHHTEITLRIVEG